MKRRLLLILLVLFALGVAGGFWYYKHETRTRTVYGSSTREFVPTQAPERRRPSKKVVNREPWPLYGYDATRSHVSPYPHRPPYRKSWTVRLGYYVEFPPVVAYHRLFVSQLRARFFTIDVRNGRVIWRKYFSRYCAAASPAVGHGVVYMPYLPKPCGYGDRSKRGFVAAMRVRGGRVLWRFPATSESSPLLRGNVLYFGSWDHNLYALDVRRRKVLWKFHADAELNTSPAYANRTIYIGSDGGSVYAVYAKTGRLRWSAHSFSRFGRREYFYATPTVAYGRVYIGNTDGTVYSYGAATGHLLWAQPAGSYVYTAAAAYRDTIYVGSYDGNVYAFDAATGRRRWRYSSPGSIHGAPTVMGGLVYFSTCGTCGLKGQRYAKRGPKVTFALDARTGKRVWTFPDGHYSPIVADGERVYLTGSTREYGLVPLAEIKKQKQAKARAEERRRRAQRRRAAQRRQAP
jgi:outer membrane protein assembly factor BamB